MRRRKRALKQNRIWVLALFAAILVSAGIFFAPFSHSTPVSAARVTNAKPYFALLHHMAPNGQIPLTGDVEIESGDTWEGDLIVTSGDVKVESEGRVLGNLTAMSGDVKIEKFAIVEGDILAFSGDLEIAGKVTGRVATVSGDIELKSTAFVGGDISVVSGDVERHQEARVSGNVIRGPNIDHWQNFAWPSFVPDLHLDPHIPNIDLPVVIPQPSSFAERLGHFLLRALGVAAIVLALMTGAVIITAMRPHSIQRISDTIRKQMGPSLIVGMMINMPLLFLTGLLKVIPCLTPLALFPALLLIFINLAGLAALGYIVGSRVTNSRGKQRQPTSTVALGTFLLLGGSALLWLMNGPLGCLRVLVAIVWIVLASIGTGAVVLPWLRKKPNGQSSTSRPRLPSPIDDGPGPEAAGVEASPQERNTDATATEHHEDRMDASSNITNDTVDGDSAVAPDELIEEISVSPEPELTDVEFEDDFTWIRGVDIVIDQLLKKAGVRTFVQLVKMTPEEIGEIIEWTPERVELNDLIGQAEQMIE